MQNSIIHSFNDIMIYPPLQNYYYHHGYYNRRIGCCRNRKMKSVKKSWETYKII